MEILYNLSYRKTILFFLESIRANLYPLACNVFFQLSLFFALIFGTLGAIAQPAATLQPSNFPTTCQPNSNTTFTHTQEFRVERGSCGNNGSISFVWQYFNGTSWIPVSNNTPVGFLTYAAVSSSTGSGSNVVGRSTLSITLGPNAATGTFQFRTVATHTGCATPLTSNQISFTVNPKPVPTFTAQAGSTGCINTDYTYTTEASQSGYVWGIPGIQNTDYAIVSGSIGSTSNTVTLRWLTPGIKTVTINYSNGTGCTAASPTSSTPTNVTAAPTPTFTAGSAGVCTGTDVTYTTQPGFLNYTWTFPGTAGDYSVISGGTSTSNTVTLRWLSPGNKVVTVNYSNANGCAATSAASYATLVNAVPAATFTTAPGATTCISNSVTYTTQSGQSSYVWSVSGILNTDYIITGGGLGSGDSTVTLQWLTNGDKTVTVNYNDTSGCTATAPATSNTAVSSAAIPQISASGPLNYCEGGSVTLTSDVATTYQWYLDDDPIAGATNQSHIANSTGSYVVRVTNAAGCEATSASTTVIENTLPDITVSTQASSLCFTGGAQTSQLNFSNTDGSPTSYSITWTGAAPAAGFQDISNVALPASSIPIVVPATASGNTVYAGNLTVTNANGCVSTVKTFTVALTSPPNVSNFSISAAAGCAGTGSVVTVASSTIVNGTYTVTYNLAGANAASTTATMVFNNGSGTFVANAPLAGTTDITVTQLALVGCSSQVSSNNTGQFTINSLPSVNGIAGSSTVCAGSNTVLTNATPGGIWTTSEPSIATISATGEVTGVVAGSVVITYTTPPDGITGCTNSVTHGLTVNALPEIQAITGSRNLCVSSSSTLENATSGGTWTSSILEVATIDPVSGLVTTHDIGSTTITYTTATDGQGCANSTSVTINVQPPPTVVAGPELEVCESATPIGIALAGASFGGSATSATWVIVDGGGTLSNTGPTTEPANVIYTPAANFSGTVTLSLVSNALNSCTPESEPRTVNVTGRPVVVAGDAITVCQSANPVAIVLSGSSISAGGTMGTWSVTGGGTLSSTAPTSEPELVTFTPEANFTGTVTLTLTSNASGSCEVVSASRTINMTAPPTADAGGELSTCGTGVAINISGGASATNYTSLTWETSGSGSFTNITSLTDAMYTPSDADILAGGVTISLRVNGGACEDAVESKTLTITPAATAIAGTEITVCAGPDAVNITAGSSATNASAVLWTSNGTGTISDPSSLTAAAYTPGAGETGTITLTLTSTGNSPCIDAISTKSITINPNATLSLSSDAATAAQTPCINTAIAPITYAVSGGGTGADFSGLPLGVTGNFADGVASITGIPTVSGLFTYTVTTTGTCSQTSLTGTINISPVTVGGTLSPTVTTACMNSAPGTITLSGATGEVIRWEYSTNGGTVWTPIENTTTELTHSGLTVTTLYRAVIQSGACSLTYSSRSVVSIVPPFNPVTTASPAAICIGDSSVLSSTTGYQTAGIPPSAGAFDNANPTGWRRDGQSTGDFLPANGDNQQAGVWRETNSHPFNGVSINGSGKFAIANGSFNSLLETPVFSLIGQTSIDFQFVQAYNLLTIDAVASIEISTDGGSTYNDVLAQYSGVNSLGLVGNSATMQNTSISLANYIGLSNLRIRFNYAGVGAGNSFWVLDNVAVPATLPITYAWTSNPAYDFGDPTTGAVTVSPTETTTYILTTYVGGCAAGTSSVTVTVNPLPTIVAAPGSGGIVIACNTPAAQTTPLPYDVTNLTTGTYSITWSAAASAYFANVVGAAITPTSIGLAVPGGVPAGTYTGSISVRNANGCTSNASDFSLVINPLPTLATVTSPPVCDLASGSSLPVNLTGLLPNMTSVIEYNINGGSPISVSVDAGATGAGSFSVNVTAANNGQSLTITRISTITTAANTLSCSITPNVNNTLVLSVFPGYVWTGLGLSGAPNWNDPLNWLCGVPINGSSVIIPQVTNGNFPIMTVDFNSNNFDLLGNATIALNGWTLDLGTSIASNIRNDGWIIGSQTSRLIIKGVLTDSLKFVQPLAPAVGTTNALLDFTLNSAGQTVLLGNSLWVYGNAYPTAGVINSDGNLTMVSTATTSSNITETTAPSNVNGIVNVQSYVAGQGIVNVPSRGFVSMSSPINDALLASGNKTYKQMQQYVIITGPGGMANGFDQGGVQQPYAETITTYNEPAAPLAPSAPSIQHINDANIPGTGFLLFFRGTQGGSYALNSNKLNAPFVTPDPATITFRGVINKFNLAPTVLSHTNYGDRFDGFNLIGNPYPSAINWTNLYASRSSDAVLNTFMIVLPGGKQASYLDGIVNNLATTIIQPAQGFYVVTTSNGASVTFTESVKSTSPPARLLTAPKEIIMTAGKVAFSGPDEVKDAPKRVLKLRLEDDLDNDETTLIFSEGGSMIAGYEDAINFSSGRVSLSSLSSDNIRIAINGLPDIEQVKEVRLNVNAAASKEVKLNFTDLSQTQGYEVYLKDSLLGKLIDVKLNPIYPFAIDKSKLETYGNKRFSIVFKKEEVFLLELESFNAKKQNEWVVLTWEIEAKGDAKEFIIEQSADGLTFHNIGSIRSQGNIKGTEKYHFTDKEPVQSLNYYRVRQIHLNGRESLSEIRSIDYSNASKGLHTMAVYPNPANEMLEAAMAENPKEAVEFNVMDMQGKRIYSTTFSADERWMYNVGRLQPSIYIIEVKSNKTSKILGRAKFVKGN